MTSIETGPTWSERLNPRNWTLAWKLVIVGLVPALLALALGVLRVADQAGDASELGRSSRLLEVRQQVAGAADALRQERDEAALFVAGNRTGDRGVLDIGFGQTDGAINDMLGAVRGTTDLDVGVSSALQQTEGGLAQVSTLRTDVTNNPAANTGQIRDRYTGVISSVDVLDRALLRQLRTPEIAGLADALTATTSATEQLALQHTVLGAAIRSGRLLPEDASLVSGTDNQLTADYREYQVALTPEQLAAAGNFLDNPPDRQRQELARQVLATPPGQPVTVTANDWDAAYTGVRTSVDNSVAQLRQQLSTASTAAEERASNLAGINSVVLMLGLLIGITIAILIARSLIRSLRVLRTAALDVAERRLPQAVESMRAGESPDVTVDPVPLSGRDEVAQVARAFDAVHGQAVRLAADQAALQSNVSAMFVNLSRRSQALVERQLQLIEQLESNEQDPDQLSNLFQLDHLATRMRRNSENLLVLAGTDLAKRNVAPVPMVDVLRAAVSEIEQYQRIVVQAPPTATIVGRAASDLVHLLAELLDNATNFSPPDSQVVMSTTRTADGAIVVEIADRGVGMVDHELSDANQRLGGPSAVDVSASRRMGLFVVGRLGARHGVGVQLSTSSTAGPGTGLTASVTVPSYLIPSSSPAEEEKRPSAIPQQASASAPGVPPQRAGMNGNGRTGSLAALVAGTDGPANPAGVFDVPTNGSSESQLFSAPPVNGTSGQNSGPQNPDSPRSGNGGPPALPSRTPGSSLRKPEPPADRDEPEQPGRDAQQAREVAEQARRDQEAADRAANARTAQDRATQDRPTQDRSAQRQDAPENASGESNGSSGFRANGVHPFPAQPGRPTPPVSIPPSTANGTPQATDEEKAGSAQQASPAADLQRQAEQRPAEQRPTEQRPTEQQDEQRSGEQQRGGRPGEQTGARPAAQPAPGTPAQQEPFAADAGSGNGIEGPAGRPDQGRRDQVPAAPPTTPLPIVGRGPAPRPQAAGQEQRPEPIGQRPAAQAGQPAPGSLLPPAGRPMPAQQRPDELFAPSVPVIADPGSAPAAPPVDESFERGETTPIFEEIASAWFRSNRPVPVNWETEQDGSEPADVQAPPRPAPRAPAPVLPPTPTPAPRPVAPPAAEPVPELRNPEPQRGPEPQRSLEPQRSPEPQRRPEPQRSAAAPEPASAFASGADEGWRAANGIEADRPDELTAAGLPKRRPRARLVPGSAGSAVLAPPVSSRSAETIRGRLASYQQGVRQGRESRMLGGSGPANGADSSSKPASAGGTHDEESS